MRLWPKLDLIVSPFELQLKGSVQINSKIKLNSRPGYQIYLKDESGHLGRGECSPFPGLHRESLTECLKQIEQIQYQLGTHLQLETQINEKTRQGIALRSTDPPSLPIEFDLRTAYLGLIEPLPFKLVPTIEFALEEALLTLYFKKDPQSIKKLFRLKSPTFTAKINGLLILDPNSESQILSIVESLKKQGMQTIKIKVGRHPADFEIKMIRQLSEKLGPHFQIRLDGNRLFDLKSFIDFAKQLDHLPIEYFEEPLNSSTLDPYHDSPLPIALDESVSTFLDQVKIGTKTPKTIEALVIKPSTLGGIHKTVQLIDYCNEHQLKCVLSSAFDSGWNIATYALLSQLCQNETALGIDTYRFLATDTLDQQLHFSEGKLWMNTSFWGSTQSFT